MQRDVAAVIDVSTRQFRRFNHRAKDLLGNGSRDGSHRRNELRRRERRNRGVHSACDVALQRRIIWMRHATKLRQFITQRIKQARKTLDRGLIRRVDIRLNSVCLDDQVNRTVLQMQAFPIRKPSRLRHPCHARPVADCGGN